MARERVRFACGCEREIVLSGNRRDRERRIEWLSKQVCYECQRAQARPVLRLARYDWAIAIYNGYDLREQLKSRGWRFENNPLNGARWIYHGTLDAVVDEARHWAEAGIEIDDFPGELSLRALLDGDEAAWAYARERDAHRRVSV